MGERPAIVDLRDLAHRYMWNEREIARFITATGLEVEPRPYLRDFAPPRVLVVIAPWTDGRRWIERAWPWLADCSCLVIVRDLTDEAATTDPELVELLEAEWRETLLPFPGAITFDWLDASDPSPCRAALELAVARAAQPHLPGAYRAPPALGSRPRVARERSVVDLELPRSGWFATRAPYPFSFAEAVANRLAIRDGRAVLLGVGSPHVDLASPQEPIELDPLAACRPLPLAAATLPKAEQHPGLRDHGEDPIHPVAWRGHRMAVYWSYVGATAIGLLSATDHDYSCGPEKKLWGYADNDPVAVALAPAADICAQRFEHDVLLTENVPVAWHRAGDVDVAAFAPDPRRALFYAQTAEFAAQRATEDLLDGDNRELAPVLVLGPSAEHRYALGLEHRVVRIVGARDRESAEVVGGPDDGFAVFDADHRLVRRARGRLLGGWFRHLTIEDGAELFREDLVTGARVPLGPSTRDEGELTVVAIPGTRNVIEVVGSRMRVV